MYSNICFYIPNIACNMISVWLKSPRIISHDLKPTILLVSEYVSAALKRSLQRDLPGVLMASTDVISSSDPWCARMSNTHHAMNTNCHNSHKHVPVLCTNTSWQNTHISIGKQIVNIIFIKALWIMAMSWHGNVMTWRCHDMVMSWHGYVVTFLWNQIQLS